jgi:hypothetical protein
MQEVNVLSRSKGSPKVDLDGELMEEDAEDGDRDVSAARFRLVDRRLW